MPLLLRRDYDPARLVAAHPPRLRHPHKQLVFGIACPPGAVHGGRIAVTRWSAEALPAAVALASTAVTAAASFYDYAGGSDGVWHVNFADPLLFVAYGSSLLAQDELQCAEHPLLGCVREALIAEDQDAITEDNLVPTPVLVADVERRCAIATEPDLAAGRLAGLYGNRFAAAPADVVRRAVRVLDPPTRTNLIAIAAPGGGRGAYRLDQLQSILVTAYTGYTAAAHESARLWPGAPVEVRTGFWGCGAFGGNRHAMTVLQILAARLARIDRMCFHVAGDAGRADFAAGAADLERMLAAGSPGEPLVALLERIRDRGYLWGVSDGN